MSTLEQSSGFAASLAAYDRAPYLERLDRAAQQRQEALGRFALEAWSDMPLERYALGQEGSDETFCYWMEFRTPDLGSIRGGTAAKHLIYKRRGVAGWHYDAAYANEREAWASVRAAFVQAFEYAAAGDWDAIDSLAPLRGGPSLRLKALHLYFPDEILPIYSQQHIRHFLRLLGDPHADDRSETSVRLNRRLLRSARAVPELEGWTTLEAAHFLYDWADPRHARRVVTVSPAANGRFWRECLEGGYVCVDWDDIGDLKRFASKEAFRTRFEQVFGDERRRNRALLGARANELWALRELEPGDIVVVSQGGSRALATGEVLEPGYEWRPDRPACRHTVRVRWDTSRAIPLEAGTERASTTAALLPDEPVLPAEHPPPVPVFAEIARALERKGQVVLYGPPGTGKTYTARRFAVYWLLRRLGATDAGAVFTDAERFEQAERSLATPQAARKVWWAVANPKEWTWNTLFEKGEVRYRLGRLKRNYALVQPGDLVIGYQSAPSKRVVALAEVTAAFGAREDVDPGIRLAPVAKIANGPSYEELLVNPTLALSEPMRFRNQGALFSLTADEAEHALALLTERDPEIRPLVEGAAGIGPLTRLTFHPSYSYEDFVEGFRPVDAGGGSLALRLEDGIFKRVCQEAHAQPERPFLVLIDEINRANLGKVFGELITLLEADKRGLTVTLPQSKERFSIPRNVFLLGTMNTADRSVKLLDTALRRRFAFVEFAPDAGLLEGAAVGPLPLDRFLEELNRRIARALGREKRLGHSFLMAGDGPIDDPEEFADRFRHEILPLLQEHCYEDYATLAGLLGDGLVDSDEQGIRHECLHSTDCLLAALADELTPPGGILK